MFISDPVNYGALADRRRRLLSRLTNRLAGRPGGPGVGARMGMASVGRPFKAYGDFRAGPAPMVTRPFGLTPPGLAALLGPGGVGRPLAGESSQAPGQAIASSVVPGRGIPSTPLTGLGLVGLPDIHGRPISPGPPPHPGDPSLAAPSAMTEGTGLIPLQGGLMLDPTTGRIVQAPTGAIPGASNPAMGHGAVV